MLIKVCNNTDSPFAKEEDLEIMLYNYNPLDKENHPTMFWLGVLFLAILWTAIEAPLSFVLDYKVENFDLYWDAAFCCIFMLDIYFRLTGKLKLPKHNIHYLGQDETKNVDVPYHKTLWLPVDILTSLPFDIIVSALGLAVPVKVLSLLRLCRIIRVVKLRTLLDIADFLPKAVKIGVAVSGVVLALHWIACGWMLITPRPDLDPWSYYNVSLYWTVTTLTTVGYGDITPQTNIGRLFTMGVMLIGVATYGIIIGNFSRMIMLADRHNEEKKEKMNNLHSFLKYYHIPNSLQRQVVSFYNHLLNKKISEEDSKIFHDLPQALQNELQIYMKIHMIRNVHIFQNCSTPCLKMIAGRLAQTFHTPGDYIIQKGDEGAEMFIIGHGDVEVCLGEKVLTTLKAGQFFGEIALLEDTIRTADVRAKSYCDLYTLKKSDFLEVIEKYPDLGEKFMSIYHKLKNDRKADTPNNKQAA